MSPASRDMIDTQGVRHDLTHVDEFEPFITGDEQKAKGFGFVDLVSNRLPSQVNFS